MEASNIKTLLTGENISSIRWENANHVYALGSDAKGGKLWAYTATPTSVTEARASPYSITNAGIMYGQPLKLPFWRAVWVLKT